MMDDSICQTPLRLASVMRDPSIVAWMLLLVFLWPANALGETPVSLSYLPPPPAELSDLIKRGKVKFATGKPDVATSYSAETRYRITFDYKSHVRWSYIPSRRELRITLKLKELKWEPDHTIWIRVLPSETEFWSSRLVLHEFDHVRLSLDARLRAPLDALVKRSTTLTHAVSRDETRIDGRLVNRVVDDYVQELFQKSHDLIAIRYKELDRETLHGREPVPKNSPLQKLLQPESPQNRASAANRR